MQLPSLNETRSYGEFTEVFLIFQFYWLTVPLITVVKTFMIHLFASFFLTYKNIKENKMWSLCEATYVRLRL